MKQPIQEAATRIFEAASGKITKSVHTASSETNHV